MLDKAQAIQSEMVEWRRDIHMHPELGFKEHRTAAKVAEIMTGLGYRVRTGVGKTDVLAEIGEGKPVVAIRADMDALPIIDAKDVPYKSQTEGVMHACGHDAHVAIAMGTAKLLAQEEFVGTVRFLFQPAEEMPDDEGLSGAPRMIDDGAIEGVDYVLALHVDSTTATGEILIDDFASAGVDLVKAKIIGKGGHGAMPHTTVDPIFISGHVILALQGDQTFSQISPGFECILLQRFLFDHFQNCQPRRTGYRVSAEGVEITGFIRQGFGNLWTSDDGSQRMPVAHRLSQGHNIGDHIIELETPEMLAETTEAPLNFIRHTYSASSPRLC